MKILVTGGAGFIGSHLVRALWARGHQVVILDLLVPQVHGYNAPDPILPHGIKFIRGDVTNRYIWQRALLGVEVVYHLAAEVGVGQSMYEIERYVNANSLGTAIMLEQLIEQPGLRKLIVASSMSIYGEGVYHCAQHGDFNPALRAAEQLSRKEWETLCSQCGQPATPIGTREDKPLAPASIYAISKMDQEMMCLTIGKAYHIPTVALRFFNVYGPGQALSNPYTGALAIFCARLLNGKRPILFEDGRQLRDFIHVQDVVQGLLLAQERNEADYQAINLGTGSPASIKDMALLLAQAFGLDLEPEIVNRFRVGDIRHCYADISKARGLLGFAPHVTPEQGITELADSLHQQTAADRVGQAMLELEQRGLITV